MATKSIARERRDIWKLTSIDVWHPTILWYAKAIAAMQGRQISEPLSWGYQAAIHDYDPQINPAPAAGEKLPPSSEQERFWKKCQHGSWYFLPWHRMYLAYFERIVAATVAKLGGDPNWALPYWNYSDATNPDARQLPPAFRTSRLPDGTPNPLHIAQRDQDAQGDVDVHPKDVELKACLDDGVFAGTDVGAKPGFGGLVTGFSHSGGGAGGLENVPHGAVHVAVGGFMGAFETAGLDPIFWLHHANVDRLWEVWRNRNASHTNPTDARWLDATGIRFEFHDESGAIVRLTPRQVGDTSPPSLNYRYEDVSDPLPHAAPQAEAELAMTKPSAPSIPEMVGATSAPLDISSGAATVRVDLQSPRGPAQLESVLPGAKANLQVFLNLENITAQGAPSNYSVYLNVPQGEDPGTHEELYAGTLSTFGAAEATRAQHQHGGSGLTHVLDITDLVERLESQGKWDFARLHVSFVSRRALKPGSQIKIGRVSVYYRSR